MHVSTTGAGPFILEVEMRVLARFGHANGLSEMPGGFREQPRMPELPGRIDISRQAFRGEGEGGSVAFVCPVSANAG